MFDLQRKFEEIIRKWNRANIGTPRNEKLLKLQSEYSELFNNDYFIFPENWFEIENQDELKIKILKEAIKNKKLIVDIEGGNTFLQKV